MSQSIWDDPEMQIDNEFVEFKAVGDSVTGIVQVVRSYRFEDRTVAPQIRLLTDDGTEKTLTAGAIRLKAALVEQRPEPGDRLTVTLTSEEPRGGGKTLRHWNVDVQRGGGQAPAQPQAAAPQAHEQAQATGNQEDIAAALANLTPEQRKILGL